MTPPDVFSPGDRVVWRTGPVGNLPGRANAGQVAQASGVVVMVAYDDTRELAELYAYTGDEQHVWHEADYLALSASDPVEFPPVTPR